MNWQYVHILAATNYLRARIASGVPDPKAQEVYEGLLDVLTPSRIEARVKAAAAPPRAPVSPPREKVTRPKAAARRKPVKRAPPATRKTR